ncbi:MAG: hypothetical protein NXI24_11805 [bacterium]|nr:hypothetical protein [bacterium]
MLVYGTRQETLPVEIAKEVSTGLPLLSEEDSIFELILAYLALPYSVAEYGCGKKASLLIEYLLNLGLPPYCLARGLIMERDMSPAALAEVDPRKRPHALILDNPLYGMANLLDPKLRAILKESCPGVEIYGPDTIHAGGYELHHEPDVQFAIARTHIFTVLTFWDEDNERAVRRVIDPTQDKTGCFPVSQTREFLHAPEALIFRAPLLGRFRLDSREVTAQQHREIRELLRDEESAALPSELDLERHADLIRRLSGAEPGSIGDPETWTYANNISTEQLGHDLAEELDEPRMRRTGRGDAFFETTERLLAAREARTGDVPVVLAELKELVEETRVRGVVREDARWAEAELEVLADVAVAIVYYSSLTYIARILQNGQSLTSVLADRKELTLLRGTGVRLRRRIDRAGAVSRAEDGRIDARALTPGFVRVTIQCIREMRAAGMRVAVDRVGNVHGMTLSEAEAEGVRAGRLKLRDVLRDSIVFGSHIDTVNDAGKFDGRLGVLSGIETAHVLFDLHRYFELSLIPAKGDETGNRPRLVTSAFIGEEMTFTGQGVSMPGSAAVAGRASVENIHAMTNGDGERWGDLLAPMLREIAAASARGEIDILNDFKDGNDHGAGDEDELFAACFDPADFFSPHSYERHIEQGPILDRHGVPMVLVDVIMGIYQEDFQFQGERAEAAALEMNVRLREIVLELLDGGAGEDVRLTVGILEGLPEEGYARAAEVEDLGLAMRWTFEGEMNHAGATPTFDRRDPGVAAARLCREFCEALESLNASVAESRLRPLRPIVSNLRTSPGTNRNVIPGAVSVSLGFAPVEGPEGGGASLDEDRRADLIHRLKGFVAGTLTKSVDRGGEGLDTYRMHEESYLSSAPSARLSIDLRSAKTELTEGFLKRVRALTVELEEKYSVEIRGAEQQRMEPSPLEASGQVLFMERSYGGSHNPRETELLMDLVRGCILQIAVAREILAFESGLPEDFHLFRLVEQKLPRAWLRELPRFTSGALHDTCNIAAIQSRSQSRT